MKKIGLLPRLFAAMAIGIVLGWLLPAWGIRLANCFRDTFGQFIKFIVPFITLGLVTTAIIDTGEADNRIRLRVHRFVPTKVTALRLTVGATHGAPEARVYEIRAY